MIVSEFSISLLQGMQSKLAETHSREEAYLEHCRLCSGIVLEHISRLKEFVYDYSFSSKEEEIEFFKTVKPKFYSQLIYHQKIVSIQSHVPLATGAEIRNYYVNELKKMNDYLRNNHEFVTYFRSGATSFDEFYFLRKQPDSWLLMNFDDYETDLNFTTIYDQKISKIIAFDMLSEFIKSILSTLEIQHDSFVEQQQPSTKDINWTASKVSLVELLYAIQSTGACNNGNIDLKQLATHFENIFNIDLGNYYRVFQEMRIRKINRTSFLDQLKERLVQRMDETDENPRFK